MIDSNETPTPSKIWTLSTTPIAGAPLHVAFRRYADRFRHEMIQGDLASASLLESVEALDETWPPSAPLQQIDQCELADGRAGLVAVGLAGRSHWSMAIEAFSDRLRFEMACRATTEPAWLGSTYRTAPSFEVSVTDEQLVMSRPAREPSAEVPPGHLRVTAGVRTRIHWQPEHRCFSLTPRVVATKFPVTLVWSYEVAWGSAGG